VEATPPQPDGAAAPSLAELPEDLKAALEQARKQYRTVELQSIAEVSAEDQFLSFIPRPPADESWPGGRLAFRDAREEEDSCSAEIVDFNPDDGGLFVYVEGWLGVQHLADFKLRYLPFDYSGRLIGAFERLRAHPELLKEGLRLACGDFEGGTLGPEPGLVADRPAQTGIEEVWPLRWGCVWGPPGTGKTQAIAEALARRAGAEAAGKILVATPTNLAADELAYRLCALLKGRGALMQGGRCLVYRGGRPARKQLGKDFPECLRDEAYAELYDATTRKLEELSQLYEAARHAGNSREAARLRLQMSAQSALLPDETRFVIAEGRASIVILTTHKAAGLVGEGEDPVLFDKVVFDEAGMVSRIAAAAISTLGRTCILAGDPKQIGPVFKAPPGLSKAVRTWMLSSAMSGLKSAKASLH
jgi:hypothetical protein